MPDEMPLVDRWLEWALHNKGRAETTCRAYRQHILRLQTYLHTRYGLTLLNATPAALEDFAGRYLHSIGIRPVSRRAPVAAIRGFYGWLVRQRLLAESPAQYLSAPKIGSPLPHPMPLASAEKLLMAPGLATFTGCRDTAMLALLIGTGCRVSGLVNLNQEDLIWTESKAGTERLVIRLVEKGKRERMVPVSLEAALLVRAYLGHPDLATIDRTTPAGRCVLFVNVRNRNCPQHQHYGENRRIRRDSVQAIIHRYGEQCGIPKEHCHPHALRHLYGTELAEGDVDLIQRQALLGHSQPGTTAVYSHLAMRKLATTVEKHNPLARMTTTPARLLANRLLVPRNNSKQR